MSNQINISVKNDISELATIVSKLEDFVKSHLLDDLTLFNINLVVEEIFTNIVFYAYSDEKEHLIDLRVSLDDNSIKIEIEDDGKEFNPLNTPEPEHIDKPLEDREVGGLGIHFVKTIMPNPVYKRRGNKNVLTLTYNV